MQLITRSTSLVQIQEAANFGKLNRDWLGLRRIHVVGLNRREILDELHVTGHAARVPATKLTLATGAKHPPQASRFDPSEQRSACVFQTG